MKNLIATSTLLILFSNVMLGQAKKDFNIDYMINANIYANSSIQDSVSISDFGFYSNLPINMNDSFRFLEKGLFLRIDTTETVEIYEKFNGYKFYIGNNSDSTIQFYTMESRLNVIAEVFYKRKWRPIEYLPSSWCGNSYYNVYLKKNEYWSFDVPKFSGNIKTKLRYRLIIDENKSIYSNEIPTSFNKKQLTYVKH